MPLALVVVAGALLICAAGQVEAGANSDHKIAVLHATGSGTVSIIPNPAIGDVGVVDCARNPGPYYDRPDTICSAGVGGVEGDDSCAEPAGRGGSDGRGSSRVTEAFDQIRFPYTLRIPSDHVLIVQGKQMPNIVTLTWQNGDSLRIEGIAIYPNPPVPDRVFSEEELEQSHKGFPFVAERVREGASWHEAVREYYERQAEIERAATERYRATLDSTGSSELASRAVIESLDRSLLMAGSEPTITNGTLAVLWDSDPLLPEDLIPLAPGVTRRPVGGPTERISPEREAKNWAFRIILGMEPSDHTPGLMIITPTGMISWQGPLAIKGIDQVESAKRGLSSRGPVGQHLLEDIIRTYGGE